MTAKYATAHDYQICQQSRHRCANGAAAHPSTASQAPAAAITLAHREASPWVAWSRRLDASCEKFDSGIRKGI